MKKNNKKGFTLAELLIVVAIIAVLVAIAIPIFTSQLEKSRESTDAANIRDYYAEISSQLLIDPLFTDSAGVEGKHETITLSGGKTATYATVTDATASVDGKFTITVGGVDSKQTQKYWQTGDVEVGGFTIASSTDDTDYCGKNTITYTFTVTSGNNGGNTYLSGIGFTKVTSSSGG